MRSFGAQCFPCGITRLLQESVTGFFFASTSSNDVCCLSSSCHRPPGLAILFYFHSHLACGSVFHKRSPCRSLLPKRRGLKMAGHQWYRPWQGQVSSPSMSLSSRAMVAQTLERGKRNNFAAVVGPSVMLVIQKALLLEVS